MIFEPHPGNFLELISKKGESLFRFFAKSVLEEADL